MTALYDGLIAKIKTLNERVWDRQADEQRVQRWLDNFDPLGVDPDERTHALYLLSQFLYLGSRQMRKLMRVVFRDLFKYPIVEKIRVENADTTKANVIDAEFSRALI